MKTEKSKQTETPLNSLAVDRSVDRLVGRVQCEHCGSFGYSDEKELEEFHANEPKKVSERNYWRNRARELERENARLLYALMEVLLVVEDSPVKTYQRMEDIARAAISIQPNVEVTGDPL